MERLWGAGTGPRGDRRLEPLLGLRPDQAAARSARGSVLPARRRDLALGRPLARSGFPASAGTGHSGPLFYSLRAPLHLPAPFLLLPLDTAFPPQDTAPKAGRIARGAAGPGRGRGRPDWLGASRPSAWGRRTRSGAVTSTLYLWARYSLPPRPLPGLFPDHPPFLPAAPLRERAALPFPRRDGRVGSASRLRDLPAQELAPRGLPLPTPPPEPPTPHPSSASPWPAAGGVAAACSLCSPAFPGKLGWPSAYPRKRAG